MQEISENDKGYQKGIYQRVAYNASFTYVTIFMLCDELMTSVEQGRRGLPAHREIFPMASKKP